MGLFYLVGVFSLWDGLWAIFISSSIAYLISTYVQDPKMPWIAFAALMGHMSISQIQRQRANTPGTIDITGISPLYDGFQSNLLQVPRWFWL
jgi:lysophospholipid acyltransferase